MEKDSLILGAPLFLRMENRLHTVIGLLLALVFAVFAILQVDDPDPLMWIAVYGLLLVLLLANIFKPLPIILCLLALAGAVMGTAFLWPSDLHTWLGGMEGRPSMVLARELLGLILCAMACVYMMVRSWVRRPRTPGRGLG